MKRSSISSLLLCVALLTVAPGTLAAQDGEGIIRINGGSMTIALHAHPQKIEQPAEDSFSLVTIYKDPPCKLVRCMVPTDSCRSQIDVGWDAKLCSPIN
jgi:hypothetical protein